MARLISLALVLVLISCIAAACGGGLGGLEVYGVSPMDKITPEQVPSAQWLKRKITLDCARNESEAFQVVIRANGGAENLVVSLHDLRGPGGVVMSPANVRVYKVDWVDINAPFELDKPSENPNFQPDPLTPVDLVKDRFSVIPGRNLILWLTVTVPEEMHPGQYQGGVNVFWEGLPVANLSLDLSVRRFTLPKLPILKSMVGLAEGNIYKAHGCKTPEEKEKVVRLYFEEYIRARLSPFLYAPGTMAFNPLPNADINWEFISGPDGKPTGEVKLDFGGFDREAAYYLDQRNAFSALNFAPYMWSMRKNYRSDEMYLRFSDVKETVLERHNPDGSLNPVFDKVVVAVFRGIAEHLAEKGWLDRAIYYVADEPANEDVPALKEICELVRQANPLIRTALTYDPAHRPRLAELVQNGKSLVSIWIPYGPLYNEEVAADQRKKGADYWLYDVSDHALISASGQKNRSIFWRVWQRNASGYLYYLSTWWGRQATPWERPNFILPEFNYKYREGNGYFFYPPQKRGDPVQPILDHVVPSIRWELMREGAEDYDYLRMLEHLVAQAGNQKLSATIQGSEALAAAHLLALDIFGTSGNYAIRDLIPKEQADWSANLEEGWLTHPGGKRSDLPIEIRTVLPDGHYELLLNVYDDSSYRGKPYSCFLLDGRRYATPISGLKGAVDISAGLVEVRQGKCAFTFSSVNENCGVIMYRLGLKRATQKPSGDLYEVRRAVAHAIESLQAALEQP